MGEGEVVEPLLGLYKEGWGCLFQHNIEFLSLSLSFSDLERTPLFWSLHLVGGFTIIRTLSRCRAAGIGIRINLLSAYILVRSPEGRRLHCTCVIPRGTTRVVLLHRWRFFNTRGLL